MEDLLIKQIENGIRAIRLGTKRPQEVEVNNKLERLTKLNEGMANDLSNKYIAIINDFSKRKLVY